MLASWVSEALSVLRVQFAASGCWTVPTRLLGENGPIKNRDRLLREEEATQKQTRAGWSASEANGVREGKSWGLWSGG